MAKKCIERPKDPEHARLLGNLGAHFREDERKEPTDRELVRSHAKGTMRRATQDWVDGRITTREHNAVHARGRHVLEGKHPRQFKGKSGERKIRGLM